MKMNKTALLAACAIILSSTSLNASAGTNIDFGIYIGNPPPPIRYEAIPSPRVGSVWVPGFWDWDGRRHNWVRGHWERARPGYVYIEPHWRETNRGWHLSHGEWKQGRDKHHHGHGNGHKHGHHKHGSKHDRDHDGVPNRFDDHPNNPYRD